MKRVEVRFKDGTIEVYKTMFTSKVLMYQVGYDFFVRNSHIPKLKECLNLESFYRKGINSLPATSFFGVRIRESEIDGRTKEARGLNYFSISHLVRNLV